LIEKVIQALLYRLPLYGIQAIAHFFPLYFPLYKANALEFFQVLGNSRLGQSHFAYYILAYAGLLVTDVLKNSDSCRMSQYPEYLGQFVLMVCKDLCFGYTHIIILILQYYDNMTNKKSQKCYLASFLKPGFSTDLVGVIKILIGFGQVYYPFDQANKSGNPKEKDTNNNTGTCVAQKGNGQHNDPFLLVTQYKFVDPE
jgi:hypothetical protein